MGNIMRAQMGRVKVRAGGVSSESRKSGRGFGPPQGPHHDAGHLDSISQLALNPVTGKTVARKSEKVSGTLFRETVAKGS